MPDPITPPISVFGEEIDPEKPSPIYLVPPADRKDRDEGPGSDALDVDDDGVATGDDLDGWQPGDPV